MPAEGAICKADPIDDTGLFGGTVPVGVLMNRLFSKAGSKCGTWFRFSGISLFPVRPSSLFNSGSLSRLMELIISESSIMERNSVNELNSEPACSE
ncbi:hypothetical protein OGAPHI_000629 [Ogataea philodendri]|uniref:Uncharacterized protein n=1 Tax=Ogataea philodendri TaxID=1378263 RepID=A0A9P8PEQ7_9ASCO|nr:uncharacterized protein OGAPHI_000629 [Ogataea philodendri]KAH3670918.1 hypothetical protein OGAPHI_000629 [Ogataea philodendri]